MKEKRVRHYLPEYCVLKYGFNSVLIPTTGCSDADLDEDINYQLALLFVMFMFLILHWFNCRFWFLISVVVLDVHDYKDDDVCDDADGRTGCYYMDDEADHDKIGDKDDVAMVLQWIFQWMDVFIVLYWGRRRMW